MNKRIAALTLTAVTSIATLTGCGLVDELTSKVTGGQSMSDARAGLEDLHVRSSDYVPSAYDRTGQFGTAWTDDNTAEMGNNGCSTRNDILARDLKHVKYADTKKCKVQSGTLDDPYTGQEINFVYGPRTSAAVQIDHIVALQNAWVSGAYNLDQATRVNLANDPDNLVASGGRANVSKGSKDASRWMVPDNPDYRCEYAAKQVNVKKKYNLSVTPAEKYALQEVLGEC